VDEVPKPRLPDPGRPRLPGGPRRNEQANAATFAALFGLLLLAFALIAMVGLVLPQVRGLLLVLFGGLFFFAFHYLVWGWWLPKIMPRDDESEHPSR
jgi:hypothetical protein